MPKACCVYGCSSHAGRDRGVHFYRLPLTNKPLLKQWLHRMRTKTVRLNKNTRVCSKHFVGGVKRGLMDVPTVFAWSMTTESGKRPSPKRRSLSRSETDTSVDLDSAHASGSSHAAEEDAADLLESDPSLEHILSESAEEDQVVLEGNGDESDVELEGSADSSSCVTIADTGAAELQSKNDDLTQKLAEKEELEKQLRIKLEKASEVEVNLLLEIKKLTERQMEMERVEKQLEEQWQELHEELAGNSSRFSFQKISHDDDLVRFYTGLPCAEAFESQCS